MRSALHTFWGWFGLACFFLQGGVGFPPLSLLLLLSLCRCCSGITWIVSEPSCHSVKFSFCVSGQYWWLGESHVVCYAITHLKMESGVKTSAILLLLKERKLEGGKSGSNQLQVQMHIFYISQWRPVVNIAFPVGTFFSLDKIKPESGCLSWIHIAHIFQRCLRKPLFKAEASQVFCWKR